MGQRTMRLKWMMGAVALAAAFASSAASATVLYDNGPADPTRQVWRIHDRFGYDLAVSDSFTLAEDATLTGIELGLYMYPGSTLQSLDWAITTLANSYPIQATASVAASDIVDSGFGNYFTGTFALPDIHLAAGTYYLVLQNALTAAGSQYPDVYWRISNGPSVAYSSFYGGDAKDIPEVGVGSNSSAFRVIGTFDAVPEPATWAMLVIGFGAIGWTARRRRIGANSSFMAVKS